MMPPMRNEMRIVSTIQMPHRRGRWLSDDVMMELSWETVMKLEESMGTP